jgi:hypothetical protein
VCPKITGHARSQQLLRRPRASAISLSSSTNPLPYPTDKGGYSTHDTLVLLGIGFCVTSVSVLIIVLSSCTAAPGLSSSAVRVAALPSVVRVPQGLISGGQRRRGGRRQWARVGSVRGVPQPGAGWGGAQVVAGVHAPVPRMLRRHVWVNKLFQSHTCVYRDECSYMYDLIT